MKDRNYWLERGKDGPKKEGYICVGVGDECDDLASQLKLDTRYLFSQRGSGLHGNWDGSYSSQFYYLTEQKFNELFPEQKNMSYVIKPVSNEHSRAIQTRLFELGYKWGGTAAKISDYGARFNLYSRKQKTLESFGK